MSLSEKELKKALKAVQAAVKETRKAVKKAKKSAKKAKQAHSDLETSHVAWREKMQAESGQSQKQLKSFVTKAAKKAIKKSKARKKSTS